jgi:hypothetical protein
MRFALVPWIGTGKITDPYRPDMAPVALSGNLDLRNDGIARALVTLPDATSVSGTGVVDLGDDHTLRLTSRLRNSLESELGLSLAAADTLGSALFKKIGGRLRPDGGRFRIVSAGVELFSQVAIQGGATDAFTYSNGAVPSPWVGVVNTPQIVSNHVEGPTNATVYMAVQQASSSDHSSQVTVSNLGTPQSTAGAVSRNDGATEIGYMWEWESAGGGFYKMYKIGAYTELASINHGSTAGSRVMKIASTGTTHEGFTDGASSTSQTDATFSGTRVGFWMFRDSGATCQVDNWEGLPFAGATTSFVPLRRRQPFQRGLVTR